MLNQFRIGEPRFLPTKSPQSSMNTSTNMPQLRTNFANLLTDVSHIHADRWLDTDTRLTVYMYTSHLYQ